MSKITKARYASSTGRGLFAKNFVRHPSLLGSVVPSSAFLCRRLVNHVDWRTARRVVELGPGVGTLSRFILDRMESGASLTLAEKNPEFVESRFSSNSITDFTNNILSIDKIYFGRNGSLSLSDIVAGIDAPVNDDVRKAIDEAVAAINDIPEPFNETVLDPAFAPVIQNAIDKVVELRLVLENEVFPIMFPGNNKPPVDET